MFETRRRQSLLFAFGLVTPTVADVTPTFVWGFNDFTSAVTQLQECASLRIFVGPNSQPSTTPSPPYTLIAYEAAGIPTVQTLGSDVNSLFWTVDHPAGSQLILSMADASGNAGGVAEVLYTITPGTTTSCHAQGRTSPVSVTTNTTKTISSCDILPLKITGGQKPYTVTVAELGSKAVTNFTLGKEFDTLNWVNTASPNDQIIAAVSDANGVYSASTNLLTTSGTSNPSCNGLQSTEIDSTGKVSSIQSGTHSMTGTSNPSATSHSNNNSNSNTKDSTSKTAIIGGIVGGLVFLAAVAAGVIFYLRQKARANKKPHSYDGMEAYQGFGLGKVGSTPGPTQHAEEITPFVMANTQSTAYSDRSPYADNSFSTLHSPSSEHPVTRNTSYGNLHNPPPPGTGQYQMDQPTGTNQYSASLPPGAAYTSPPILPAEARTPAPPPSSTASYFDPYSNYGNTSVAPTTPSAQTSASSSVPVVAPTGYHPRASGSETRTGEPGPSITRFKVANPSVAPETVQESKQGPVPPPPPQETVYQHQDISDVVELPPAYKERSDT